MQKQLEKLKNTMAEIMDLRRTEAVLAWDQETYMPPGGAEARAEQLATVSKIAHEKFTTDEIGLLLEAMEPYLASLDDDADDAAFARIVKHDYERARKLSADMVAKLSRTASIATEVWKTAREQNDFASFQPYLERIVDLNIQKAQAWGYDEHIYDALLEDYEPGMKSSQVATIFTPVKSALIPLIKAIANRADAVDNSILHQYYDPQKQWDFGLEVIKAFGYNFEHGRQDKSVHPFTTSFGVNDVRITTKTVANYLPTSLFGSLHEVGHGLYEQGYPARWQRTGLDDAASLGIHESQSRMWENIIGRSEGFWAHYFPTLQQYFPAQLEQVDVESFYRAINKVSPSLIRIEADEVTYNLHIFLRFELERDLVSNVIKVADLPEIWNERMKSYLGIVPDSVGNGVLQDIHWASGSIGYFPTYALGNIASVQFFNRMVQDNPDTYRQIARGEFDQILAWLRANVHTYGRKYTPAQLIKRVCGESLNAEPYIAYINDKYSRIYEL